MQIIFCDEEYRARYGHGPRGLGFWGFSVEGEEFFCSGSYSDCKRAFRAKVREMVPDGYQGPVYVEVLT